MNIPECDEIEKKEADPDASLDPLERFIYEHEPSLRQREWRDQFSAAIKYITTLPKSCGNCPINKPFAVSCRAKHNSTECHSKYLEYLNK
jgi:hypothetical protein